MPWPRGRPNVEAAKKLRGRKREFTEAHRANLSRAASERDWKSEEETRRKIAETVSLRRQEQEAAKRKRRTGEG